MPRYLLLSSLLGIQPKGETPERRTYHRVVKPERNLIRRLVKFYLALYFWLVLLREILVLTKADFHFLAIHEVH